MPSLAALLGPLVLFTSGPDSCLSQEQALRTVAHDFWLGYNRRDTTLLARVLDDQLLLVPSTGIVTTKPELLAHIAAPLQPMQSRSEETLSDVRVVFAGETAVLNFRRRWSVTHRPSGVSFKATSRMTEVLVCRGHEWKVLAFQETVMPNAERPVSAAAPVHYDEYVGRYRFGSKGTGQRLSLPERETPCTRLGAGMHPSNFCRASSMHSLRATFPSKSASCATRKAASWASCTTWVTARLRRDGLRSRDPWNLLCPVSYDQLPSTPPFNGG
jgi:ketosteroid isomerase-like protein